MAELNTTGRKQPTIGNKPKNFKETIKKLLIYYKNYKKMFFVALIIALIGGVASTLSIIFSGILYAQYIIPPSFTQIDPFPYGEFGLTSFIWWCVTLIICYLISSLFNWLESYLLLKMSEGGSYSLRNAVFTKFNKLPISYFDKTPPGDTMSRSINDIDNIGQTLSQYLGNVVYWIFMIVTMLIVMLLISPILTIFAIVLIPIFLALNIFIMKKVKPYFGKQQKSLGDANGFIEEHISGLKIISLFKMKDRSSKEFEIINNQLTKNSIIAQSTTNMLMPINIFVNNMSFVILSVIGVFGMFQGGVDGHGWLSPDWGVIHFPVPSYIPDMAQTIVKKVCLLIVFTSFTRNLNNPINQLVASLGSIFLALASADRVMEILDQPDEKEETNAIELKEAYGLIEAENLNFSYVKGKPILKNINFHVKPNEIVALVGPTGAGKTTIVNLITKFYEINSGYLKIDGYPTEEITRESLRKHITMVLQDVYLFNTSIKENIRYGNLKSTDKDVIKAAKLAHAHDFISTLPKGYDTILEDNGNNLSQGQRQLLAIARAFLSNSKIVILDEATSSIDTRTELLIQNAMNSLMKNRTTFVIAHRLSTIKNADLILVIKSGEIVERGKHDDLLKLKNGFYAKLYNSQFKGLEI